MPRIARIIAPGYPHHITQRGNNRGTVFFDDEDRRTYLKLLAGHAQKHDLRLWAYCLMDNHLHLLVVPGTETALARGIGLTNQMYTQFLNRKLQQSGRVWQNRFFSCIVQNDQYLWAVARYIEGNPIKAGLVECAESYRWSSAQAHILGSYDPLLNESSWLSPQERGSYAQFVRGKDDKTDNAIRRATRNGRPFGSDSFMDMLESQLNQPVKAGKPGRPCTKTVETGECP